MVSLVYGINMLALSSRQSGGGTDRDIIAMYVYLIINSCVYDVYVYGCLCCYYSSVAYDMY